MASNASNPQPRAYNERAKRYPAQARLARRLLKHNAVIRREGSATIVTLPVNYRYKAPNRIDRERGVTYAEVEQGTALIPPQFLIPLEPMPDELIAAELLLALAAFQVAAPADLAKWAKAAAARAGGNVALARELVRLEPDPARTKTDERNMLRKVEEWRQGKYKKAAGRNARRVAAYVLTHAQTLAVGITGHWWMLVMEGKAMEGPIYRRFNTFPLLDDEIPDRAVIQDSLAREGTGLIEEVQHSANDTVKAYAVYLETVNGVHLELEP